MTVTPVTVELTIYNEEVSWYGARTRCTERGEKLAVLGESHSHEVLQYLYRTIDKYFNVWVGLRKSDYFSHPRKKPLETYNWNPQAPCPCVSTNACATVEKKANIPIFWTPKSCDSTSLFLCFQDNADSEIITDKRTNEKYLTTKSYVTETNAMDSSVTVLVYLPEKNNGIVIALITFPIIVCVLAATGFIICCFLRKKNLEVSNKKRSNESKLEKGKSRTKYCEIEAEQKEEMLKKPPSETFGNTEVEKNLAFANELKEKVESLEKEVNELKKELSNKANLETKSRILGGNEFISTPQQQKKGKSRISTEKYCEIEAEEKEKMREKSPSETKLSDTEVEKNLAFANEIVKERKLHKQEIESLKKKVNELKKELSSKADLETQIRNLVGGESISTHQQMLYEDPRLEHATSRVAHAEEDCLYNTEEKDERLEAFPPKPKLDDPEFENEIMKTRKSPKVLESLRNELNERKKELSNKADLGPKFRNLVRDKFASFPGRVRSGQKQNVDVEEDFKESIFNRKQKKTKTDSAEKSLKKETREQEEMKKAKEAHQDKKKHEPDLEQVGHRFMNSLKEQPACTRPVRKKFAVLQTAYEAEAVPFSQSGKLSSETFKQFQEKNSNTVEGKIHDSERKQPKF